MPARWGKPLKMTAAAAGLAGLVLMALCLGPYAHLSAGELWFALRGLIGWAGGADEMTMLIVRDIRLPRIVLALLAGGALALSGGTLQGLFRNPLADPGLIGVSSGGAIGAVVVIIFAGDRIDQASPWAGFLLPLASMAGAIAVTLLIYQVARTHLGTRVVLMLLCGIAVNALAGAFIGLAIYLADDQQMRAFTFWSMGSLAQSGWGLILPALLLCLPAAVVLFFQSRKLDAMLLGEAQAWSMGVDVQVVKHRVILASAALAGATVALCGMIGFIGLVAPHLARLIVGPEHRTMLPLALLLGAILLLVADTLARLVVAPAEVPVGIFTALLGAPFFLALLLHRRANLV
jgi:iron complex transport system permease protein